MRSLAVGEKSAPPDAIATSDETSPALAPARRAPRRAGSPLRRPRSRAGSRARARRAPRSRSGSKAPPGASTSVPPAKSSWNASHCAAACIKGAAGSATIGCGARGSAALRAGRSRLPICTRIATAHRREEDVLVAPHDALGQGRSCRRCTRCSGRRRCADRKLAPSATLRQTRFVVARARSSIGAVAAVLDDREVTQAAEARARSSPRSARSGDGERAR